MKTIEFISVGTELLMGNITNTNASFLAAECAALGLTNYWQVTVGDNEDRLSEAIRQALGRSDIVLMTGGLGPTEDDLTRETTAKVLGLPLVENLAVRAQISDYLERGGYKKPSENNWRQAMIIEGAEVIDNPVGTAPGQIITTREGKKIILLPGPPNEMIFLWNYKVRDYLAALNDVVFRSSMVKICGLGESRVAEMIEDLIAEQSNPTIAIYAKGGEVHIRVTAQAASAQEAKALMKPVVAELKNRFGKKVFTTKEDVTLAQVVVETLLKKEMTVAFAESCTGGMLASAIVSVPGASDVLGESYITYSNEAKHELLGVRRKTLRKYDAVSEECAAEMARGAREAAGVDCAVSVTGLAGPGGGTKDKPVGTVYIGCCIGGKTIVKHYVFNGDRQRVRELSVIRALDLLRRSL